MHFLDRLRAKPKHIRSRYAFIFALCVTLLIAGLWQVSLSARLATFGQPEIEKEDLDIANEFSYPFQNAKERIRSLFEKTSETSNGTTTATTTEPSLPSAYDLIITGTSTGADTTTATSSAYEQKYKTILIATSTGTMDPQ